MAKKIDEFAKILKEIEKSDARRELVINRGRELIKLSKQITYSVHRGEIKEGEASLKELQKQISSLRGEIGEDYKLYYTGSYYVAMQEYVEAAGLLMFVKERRLPRISELDVENEEYLAGLCDLTGELARRAVLYAIKKDTKEVMAIRDVIDQVNGVILQADLRNGDLRKKSDSVKWNLKKVEEVLYDLTK